MIKIDLNPVVSKFVVGKVITVWNRQVPCFTAVNASESLQKYEDGNGHENVP